MRMILAILALSLMAGCGVPSPPKPSPYRYMAQERTKPCSPSYSASIHP